MSRPRVERVPYLCAKCGKEVLRRPKEIQPGARVCCSRRCARLAYHRDERKRREEEGQ